MSNNIQNIPDSEVMPSLNNGVSPQQKPNQQININLQGSNQGPVAKKSVLIAYILWALSLGFIPLHWFYLGKVPIFRIITFNFFGIGALIDLFKLGQYVSEYNRGII